MMINVADVVVNYNQNAKNVMKWKQECGMFHCSYEEESGMWNVPLFFRWYSKLHNISIIIFQAMQRL